MAKHARADGPVKEVDDLTPIHQPRHGTPEPEPRHTAAARVRSRRVVGVAVLAVVVGLVASGFLIRGLAPATPEPTAAQGQSTAAGAPQATTPAAGSPTRTPTTSTQTAVAPTGAVSTFPGPSPATLPQTGPGVTEPGILLVASPESDGSFDVLELVRLGSPVTALTLRPAPVDRAGQQFASVVATATAVQVSAGDQPVVVPAATVDSTTSLPVPDVDHFELRYRLTGVTVRSTPSTAGRALAAIGPLTGGVDDDLPVHVIASGDTVLGLNCPMLPLSQQSCGGHVPTGPSIEHEMPWHLAVTTVQFNLPQP